MVASLIIFFVLPVCVIETYRRLANAKRPPSKGPLPGVVNGVSLFVQSGVLRIVGDFFRTDFRDCISIHTIATKESAVNTSTVTIVLISITTPARRSLNRKTSARY